MQYSALLLKVSEFRTDYQVKGQYSALLN